MKTKPVDYLFPAISLLLHGGISRFRNKKKAEKNNSDSAHGGLWAALLLYMEEEKPYLDPNLSLHDIATGVYSNTTYISSLVNSVTGDNLSAFVNRYRVEYAKIIMSDDPYRTNEEYAPLCGFNNEVTFINWFKRYAGETPGRYRNRIRRECQKPPSRSEEQGR